MSIITLTALVEDNVLNLYPAISKDDKWFIRHDGGANGQFTLFEVLSNDEVVIVDYFSTVDKAIEVGQKL